MFEHIFFDCSLSSTLWNFGLAVVCNLVKQVFHGRYVMIAQYMKLFNINYMNLKPDNISSFEVK